MKSIRDVYKIGKGPSSSHTMGPERAARLFLSKYPDAETYRVVLYGCGRRPVQAGGRAFPRSAPQALTAVPFPDITIRERGIFSTF